jgi:BNR repeat protein
MMTSRKRLLPLAMLLVYSLPLKAQEWTLGILSTPLQYTDASSYDAFATMVKAVNGTIFNFYRKGTSHLGDRGVIMLRTSTDNGVTWALHDNSFGGVDTSHGCLSTDALGCIFADATLDSRNAFGGVSHDGSTLIIGWNTYNLTGSSIGGCASHATCQAYLSRSTDNGATWTNGSALAGYVAGYGALLVVPNGGGASGSCATGCVAISLLSHSSTIYFLFSYDNGASWTTAKIHPRSNDTGSYEMGILWLNADRLLMFVRDDNSSCFQNCALAAYYSPDMGTTWTNLCGTSLRPACGGSSNNPSPGTDPLSCLPPPSGYTYGTGAGGGCDQVSPWMTNASLPDGQVTLFLAEREFLNSISICGGNCTLGYIRSVTFNADAFISNPGSLPTLQAIVGPTQTIGAVGFGYPTIVQISSTTLLAEWYQGITSRSSTINLYTMTAQYQASPTDFTVSLSPLAPASVAPGQSTTSTVTLTSLNNFPLVVNVSCSVSPQGPDCSISPTSVTLASNGSASTMLTVMVPAAKATSVDLRSRPRGLRSPNPLLIHALWLTIAGLAMACGMTSGRSQNRRLIRFVIGCLVFAELVSMMGCQTQVPSTSPITYAVTVTATSGATTHIATLSLKVQ